MDLGESEPGRKTTVGLCCSRNSQFLRPQSHTWFYRQPKIRSQVRHGTIDGKLKRNRFRFVRIAPELAGDPLGVEQRALHISSLLKSLEESAVASGRAISPVQCAHQNRLAQVRLGLASSLFTAISYKHGPTASHCMRVALGASSWTLSMEELTDEQRDCIEVAALLHDIGKIGVPDTVLIKPGKLSEDEVVVMDHHREMGLSILKSCCASQEVLEIVQYANARFDGLGSTLPKKGADLPLGARIVSIVDAFDAMTTDHVYRPAFSRERALAELHQYAGTQFDPELVRGFEAFQTANHATLDSHVAQRWLESLAVEQSNLYWRLGAHGDAGRQSHYVDALFGRKLLDNMHDGVIFVDSQLRVFLWNRGAEQLTGVSGTAVFQRLWCPMLVHLRDAEGNVIRDEDCPIARAIASKTPSRQRMHIVSRDGVELPIELHTVPVVSRDGVAHGATLLLHDASSEHSLEERCQSLSDQASRDPLTQVANRAEFDRLHEKYIEAHLEMNRPYSLVICDIDRFKQVNDVYGHQAGDDAIKTFANLLSSHCHSGDQVARYGGEEFVLMCLDSPNARAFQRAEEIRRELSSLPLSTIGGKSITASFGVTELQPGDTAETMLRRADRALLQAKDNGRNLVIQLGAGMGPVEPKRRWWPFVAAQPSRLVESWLITAVPLEIAVEKLRGFVADHDATITSIGDDFVNLTIEDKESGLIRRLSDRPISLDLELNFSEVHQENSESRRLNSDFAKTCIHLVIGLKRPRDRRRDEAVTRARQLHSSLRSYLMAHETTEGTGTMLGKAKSILAPWRRSKR